MGRQLSLATDDDGWLWTMGCRAPRGFGGRAVHEFAPARAARAAAPHAHGWTHSVSRRFGPCAVVWFSFFCAWGFCVCALLCILFLVNRVLHTAAVACAPSLAWCIGDSPWARWSQLLYPYHRCGRWPTPCLRTGGRECEHLLTVVLFGCCCRVIRACSLCCALERQSPCQQHSHMVERVASS